LTLRKSAASRRLRCAGSRKAAWISTRFGLMALSLTLRL
jgi:hypothetical protein